MTYASDLIVYVGSRNESSAEVASTAPSHQRTAFLCQRNPQGSCAPPQLSESSGRYNANANGWSE